MPTDVLSYPYACTDRQSNHAFCLPNTNGTCIGISESWKKNPLLQKRGLMGKCKKKGDCVLNHFWAGAVCVYIRACGYFGKGYQTQNRGFL